MAFKGNPAIIRGQLKMWEGNGYRRYYYNNWYRFFEPEELYEYQKKYNVSAEDPKLGIKVFFDDEGTLHINNCHDTEMKIVIEERMKGWYRWACRQNDMRHSGDYKILDLIEPYTTEFKPGMYRVDYKEKFFIFDRDYHAHLEWAGYVRVNYNTGTYSVDTEFPKLNDILKEIMKDNEDGLTDLSDLDNPFI